MRLSFLAARPRRIVRHLKGRLNSSSCPLSIFFGGNKALAEVIAEFIDAKRAAGPA